MILLAQALSSTEQLDDNGHLPVFSIQFVTLNRSKRTGGKIKTLEGVVRCGSSHNMSRNGTISVKKLDGTGHPTPIHIQLITKINDTLVT